MPHAVGVGAVQVSEPTGQSGGVGAKQSGPATGLHRRWRASLTNPSGVVGGAEAHRTVGEEKSNLMHDMCGAGEQDERATERRW